MFWKKPHITKVYEALTAIADKRIEKIMPNKAKVFSSSKGKFYEVEYDPETNAITCNDNSAYYTDTLSYPMIAYLMLEGVIKYNPKLLEPLSGILWKDINTKFKNNWESGIFHVLAILVEKGYDKKFIEQEIDTIYQQVKKLEIKQLGEKQRPPKGY